MDLSFLQQLPSLFFHVTRKEITKYNFTSSTPNSSEKQKEYYHGPISDFFFERIKHWIPNYINLEATSLPFQNPENFFFHSFLVQRKLLRADESTLLLDVVDQKPRTKFKVELRGDGDVLVADQLPDVNGDKKSTTKVGMVLGKHLAVALAASASYVVPEVLVELHKLHIGRMYLSVNAETTELSFPIVDGSYIKLYQRIGAAVDKVAIIAFDVLFKPTSCTFTVDHTTRKARTTYRGTSILLFTKGTLHGCSELLFDDTSVRLTDKSVVKVVINAGTAHKFVFPAEQFAKYRSRALSEYLKVDELFSHFIFHRIVIKQKGAPTPTLLRLEAPTQPPKVHMLFKKDDTHTHSIFLGYWYHNCKTMVVDHKLNLYAQLFDKGNFMDVDINEVGSFAIGKFRNLFCSKKTHFLEDPRNHMLVSEIAELPEILSMDIKAQLHKLLELPFFRFLRAKVVGYQMLPSASSFVTLKTLPMVYNVPFYGKIYIVQMQVRVTATEFTFGDNVIGKPMVNEKLMIQGVPKTNMIACSLCFKKSFKHMLPTKLAKLEPKETSSQAKITSEGLKLKITFSLSAPLNFSEKTMKEYLAELMQGLLAPALSAQGTAPAPIAIQAAAIAPAVPPAATQAVLAVPPAVPAAATQAAPALAATTTTAATTTATTAATTVPPAAPAAPAAATVGMSLLASAVHLYNGIYTVKLSNSFTSAKSKLKLMKVEVSPMYHSFIGVYMPLADYVGTEDHTGRFEVYQKALHLSLADFADVTFKFECSF